MLETTGTRSVRRSSEILFLVDVSRSMLASDGPAGPSRLTRAKDIVRRLHRATPDVPTGVAGLTDRVLPYVLATSDETTFANVVDRSVAAEAPPPQEVARNATNFGALAAVPTSGFFLPSATHRTCVLVTDGESVPYPSEEVSRALDGDHGCRLVVVRVGAPDEHVYTDTGRPESGYRPEDAADSVVQGLAQATGGKAFDSRHASDAAATLRRLAETGATGRVTVLRRERRLAPVLTVIALSLAVVLAVASLARGRPVPSSRRREYPASVHPPGRAA